MHALRLGEDAAVADGSAGPEDTLQRVRRAVQVGPARARVPTRGEPDFRADSALELAPEGHGASSPEGANERTTARANVSSPPPSGMLT